MKEVFVSFITTIYDVNKYLDDLFSSFLYLDQTKFEIIAVDDKGSEDPDPYVKKWAEELPIKYIKNKKNSGIAISRNNGLEKISKKATHVIYVDSDDAICKNNFMSEIKLNEITYFNEMLWNKAGETFRDLNKSFGTNHFHGTTRGKALPVAIAREFKHDPDVKFYEDILISRRITKKWLNIINLSNLPLVKYRQRRSSITNSDITPKEFTDMQDQWSKLISENLIGKIFADYELRQRYWIWHKQLSGKVVLKKTRKWICILAFIGGNSVRLLGLKKIVYKKPTKNLFE